MERNALIINGVLAAAVLLVGGLAWSQQGEVTRLEGEVAKLAARVEAVERGRPAATVAGDPKDDEGQPRPADVLTAPVTPGAVASAGDPVTPRTRPEPAFNADDPEVRGQLREVIAEERDRERDERHERRMEARAQQVKARIGEIAKATEMDEVVEEKLNDLLVVEQEDVGEMFRKAREEMNWEDTRDKISALRADTDEKAKELLEDDEYAEYQKMREEEEERFGRRGRGGRQNDRGQRSNNQ